MRLVRFAHRLGPTHETCGSDNESIYQSEILRRRIASLEVALMSNMGSIYQLTKNGLALQLTLQATKYYNNDDLNKK
jgi:hypothetical protein